MWGREEDLINRCGGSVSEDERVPEMDSVDVCITVRIYLIPLNWTPKNGEDGKFCVMCILP